MPYRPAAVAAAMGFLAVGVFSLVALGMDIAGRDDAVPRMTPSSRTTLNATPSSPAGTPPVVGPTAAPTACDTLTREEAARVLGVPVAPLGRFDPLACSYFPNPQEPDSPYFEVRLATDFEAARRAAVGTPAFEAAEGIGDEAFHAGYLLHVRVGKAAFAVNATSNDDRDRPFTGLPVAEQRRYRDITRAAAAIVVTRVR